jgi:uncharacterized protein YciI
MSTPVLRLFAAAALLLAAAALGLANPSMLLAEATAAPAGARSHQAGEHGPGAAMSTFPLIYVVTYTPGAAYRSDRPLLQQDLREHGRYIKAQVDAGVVIAAGPTFAQPGGVVLLAVRTQEDAHTFIRNDPAVAAGVFVGVATDWRPVFDAQDRFRRQP